MHKNNKWLLIIILILIIGNSASLIRLSNNQNSVKLLRQKYEKEKEISDFNERWIITNQKGDGDSAFINSAYLDTISNLFPKTKYILVFLSSEYNCSACVDNIGDILSKYSQQEKLIKKLSLIGVSKSARSLNVFKKMYDINCASFVVPELNALGYTSSRPTFFVLDKKGNVFNYFQPEKTNRELTIKYLDLIIEKYFSS